MGSSLFHRKGEKAIASCPSIIGINFKPISVSRPRPNPIAEKQSANPQQPTNTDNPSLKSREARDKQLSSAMPKDKATEFQYDRIVKCIRQYLTQAIHYEREKDSNSQARAIEARQQGNKRLQELKEPFSQTSLEEWDETPPREHPRLRDYRAVQARAKKQFLETWDGGKAENQSEMEERLLELFNEKFEKKDVPVVYRPSSLDIDYDEEC